jgi:NOL1/NOP2/sun family putative RNA methylase
MLLLELIYARMLRHLPADGGLVKELAEKYSYRNYMIKRYLEMFGKEETVQLLEANERNLMPTLRCNTLRIDEEDFVNLFTKKGFVLEKISDIFYGYRALKMPKFSLGATTEYLLGCYFIQAEASMIPVQILDPQSGEIIIDLCAAPGGKTTQLAQFMENQGAIVATDISRKRVKSLRSNLSRCGVNNVLIIRMDARQISDLGVQADKVLLDAPCTGEGNIPRDPTRKTSRELKDIIYLSKLQKELINAAIHCIKPGGQLVYSTCAIAPEENEYVIDHALKNENLHVMKIEFNRGSPAFTEIFGKNLDASIKKARRFYPHKDKTEGFFVCKLFKEYEK